MTFRPASLSYFGRSDGSNAVRGQNFTVFRSDHASGRTTSVVSDDEILVIFPESSGELEASNGVHRIPPRSFVIAPAGKIGIRLDGPGNVYALTTGADEHAKALAVNADDYRSPDARVKPVARDRAGHSAANLRIYSIDEVQAPAGKSRLKFLQTATMSINWVEYDGPRDRTALSPHAHADFEQGSLAIAGDFVHHIRTPWTPDANQWQEDRHIEASMNSLLIIPPELIHTTEGVGSGKHILIDVFAPPREDFIAKGWVHNAHEYAVT